MALNEHLLRGLQRLSKREEAHVHLRLHRFFPLMIAGVLSAAIAAPAQSPAALVASSAAKRKEARPATATLHGHVADPTGALIPGAKVAILTADGKTVASVKADSAGSYDVHGLKPGGYMVRAEFKGFAPFNSPVIVLGPGQIKRVDISMAIAPTQQNVEVTDETNGVNVEAGGNVSAIVLKGKDLDALSDDPDELQNELRRLPARRRGRMADRSTSTDFPAGSFHPSRRFARSGSIRTRSQPSLTSWDTGASRFLPSPARTSCMARRSSWATTALSIRATHSRRQFPPTTATCSTAP